MALFGTSRLNQTKLGSSEPDQSAPVILIASSSDVMDVEDVVISSGESLSAVLNRLHPPPVADQGTIDPADKALFELLHHGECTVCHTRHSTQDQAGWKQHIHGVAHNRKVRVLDFLNDFAAGAAFEPSSNASVLQPVLTNAKDNFLGQQFVHELHDDGAHKYQCWLCSLCNVAQHSAAQLMAHLQSNAHRLQFMCDNRPELAVVYGEQPFSQAMHRITQQLHSESGDEQVEVLQFDPKCPAAERARCVQAITRLMAIPPEATSQRTAPANIVPATTKPLLPVNPVIIAPATTKPLPPHKPAIIAPARNKPLPPSKLASIAPATNKPSPARPAIIGPATNEPSPARPAIIAPATNKSLPPPKPAEKQSNNTVMNEPARETPKATNVAPVNLTVNSASKKISDAPKTPSTVAVVEKAAVGDEEEIVMLSEKIVKRHTNVVKTEGEKEQSKSRETGKTSSGAKSSSSAAKPSTTQANKSSASNSRSKTAATTSTSSTTTTSSSNARTSVSSKITTSSSTASKSTALSFTPVTYQAISAELDRYKEKGVKVCAYNKERHEAAFYCEICMVMMYISDPMVSGHGSVPSAWSKHKYTQEHERCAAFRSMHPISKEHIMPGVDSAIQLRPLEKTDLRFAKAKQFEADTIRFPSTFPKSIGSLQQIGLPFVMKNVCGMNHVFENVTYGRMETNTEYLCELCCERMSRKEDMLIHCATFEHALKLMHCEYQNSYQEWLMPAKAKRAFTKDIDKEHSIAGKQRSAVVFVLNENLIRIQGTVRVLDVDRAVMINNGCLSGSRYDTSKMVNDASRNKLFADMLSSRLEPLSAEDLVLPVMIRVHAQLRERGRTVPLLGVPLVVMVTSTNTQWNTYLCKVCPSWQADDSLFGHLTSEAHRMAYINREYQTVARYLAAMESTYRTAVLAQQTHKIWEEENRNRSDNLLEICKKLTVRIDINQVAKIWPSMVKQFMQLLPAKPSKAAPAAVAQTSPQKAAQYNVMPAGAMVPGTTAFGSITGQPQGAIQAQQIVGSSFGQGQVSGWPVHGSGVLQHNPAVSAQPQQWDSITQQFLTRLAQPPVSGAMDMDICSGGTAKTGSKDNKDAKANRSDTSRDRDRTSDRWLERYAARRRRRAPSPPGRSRDGRARRSPSCSDRDKRRRTPPRDRDRDRKRTASRSPRSGESSKKAREGAGSGDKRAVESVAVVPSALRRVYNTPAVQNQPQYQSTTGTVVNTPNVTGPSSAMVAAGGLGSEQVLSQLLNDLRSGKAPDEVAVLQVLLEEKKRQEDEDRRQQQLRLLLEQLQQQQKRTSADPGQGASCSSMSVPGGGGAQGSTGGLQQAVMRVFGASSVVASAPAASDDLVKDAALNILRTQQQQHSHAQYRPSTFGSVNAAVGVGLGGAGQTSQMNAVGNDWSRYASAMSTAMGPQALQPAAVQQPQAQRQAQSSEDALRQLQSSLTQMTDEELMQLATAAGSPPRVPVAPQQQPNTPGGSRAPQQPLPQGTYGLPSMPESGMRPWR